MAKSLSQMAVFASAIGPCPNKLDKFFVHAIRGHEADFNDFAAVAESRSRKRPIRT
jgi:hypothetical protein